MSIFFCQGEFLYTELSPFLYILDFNYSTQLEVDLWSLARVIFLHIKHLEK